MARQDLAKKRDELRSQIMSAAVAVFAEQGLNGASTQAIADQCGISKTKLHYYISGKEDLYVEVLKYIVDEWTKLQDGISTNGGPKLFFSEYITKKIQFSFQHPLEVKVFTSEVMRGAPILHELWDDSRAHVYETSKLIEQWIEDGLMRPVDPILVQFHIWALTEMYANIGEEVKFMLVDRPGVPVSNGTVIQEVTDLILQGLAITG